MPDSLLPEDEIARLRAENEELRAALDEVGKLYRVAERPAWSGDEVARIASFGFTRGVIVRERADGPNMLVVRGMGETTVVLVIEGDEGGTVRLRERPTAGLHQVLAAGDYAKTVRAPNDWEPGSASPSSPTTGGAA